jgi:hypothetical protein
MRDLQAIADRVEVEALPGEFTDAVIMHDHDRLASRFTRDGALRIPDANIELGGRQGIRALGERREDLADYFVQTTHLGMIRLDGDTASGRVYTSELIHSRDGNSYLNYAVDDDRYQRARTAGSSPSASTRSGTSTPVRWRARRPTPRGAPADPPAGDMSSAKGGR